MLVDILNSLILLYSKLYQNRAAPLGGLQACHSVVGQKIEYQIRFCSRGRKGRKKLLSRVGRRGDKN